MGAPLAYNATVVGRNDLTDSLATFLIEPDVPRGGRGSPPGSTASSA
jgi:hypothetical protein